MSTPSPSPVRSRPPAARPFAAARWYFLAAAIVSTALAVAGFKHFYFEGRAYPGREITPPIRGLVIAHGVAMSAWLLLFLVQPALIALGRRRVHMALGKAGAVLAVFVFALMLWISIASVRVLPHDAVIWGLPSRQFMAVPFFSAWMFGGFVAAGVALRRTPAAHRAMMLLATLAALSAGVSRIDPLSALYLGTIWERLFGPFFLTLVLGLLLVAARAAIVRRFDRWLAGGLAALIAASAATMAIAPTGAWAWFTSIAAP